MPHKCVRCGKVFGNGSSELLRGCECGSRVFIFLKGAQEAEEVDVTKLGWLEQELGEFSKEKPVSLELDAAENVKILEKGAYELNVKSLMDGNPLVVKNDKGVYFIKIPPLRKR